MYFVPTNNIDVSNNLVFIRQQQLQQVTEEQYLFAQQQQSLLQQQQEQASTRLHFPVSPSFSPASPLASPNPTSTLPSSLLVPSPPDSPMTSTFETSNPPTTTTVPTLGKPNRACASCKKRKVKCDRKTPSCTACQKSKLPCYYTSYSPSAFIEKQTMAASSVQQQQQQHHHHDLSEEQQQDDGDDDDDDNDDDNDDEGGGEEEKEETATLMIMIRDIHDRMERIENESRQRWEHIQKMYTELQSQFQQQQCNPNSQYPYLLPDDDATLLKLNLVNPKAPLTKNTITTIPRTPLRNSASTSPSQAPPLILRNSIRRSQSPTPVSDPLIPNQHPHNFSPYPLHSPQKSVFNNSNSILSAQQVTLLPTKRAIITFNYKFSGLRQLLDRAVVPMLSATTSGSGPQIPIGGFQDPLQMQSWFSLKLQAFVSNTAADHYLTEKFGNILDADERFQLRPLNNYNIANATSFSPHQQFEIVLCRVVKQSETVQSLTSSLPGLYDDEMDGSFEYEGEEEAGMDTKSNTTIFAGTSNNAIGPLKQLIDNSDDVFLSKVYALIRLFISHLPWIRENYLTNWRATALSHLPAVINEIDCWNDGLFSDVIVQVISDSPDNVVRRERLSL